jgi:hypothetical protein
MGSTKRSGKKKTTKKKVSKKKTSGSSSDSLKTGGSPIIIDGG